MAIDCIYDPTRKKHGYSDQFYNRLKGVWNKVPSKAEFTNTVRRLGVDDLRMVNVKDESGSRLLGKNLTDVKDLDFSKGAIPSSVVVRVPSAQGEKYFVSNGKPTSAPTRWIRDELNGRLKANPEWDQINVNVTGLARYVQDSDGAWRVAKEGEEGSFLNIQNPVKGEQDIDTIFQKGYDAIELEDGRYRLIDGGSQSVQPKKVTSPPDKSQVYSETIETPPSTTEVAETLIKDYQVPQRIAYSIAGGLVGNYVDEDSEFAGTFWGGALGLALGSAKVRGKFKGMYHRVNGSKGKDFYDKLASTQTIKEREQLYLEEALRKGYKGDVTDPDAVSDYVRFKNDVENKRLRGEGISRFFDNEYFRSGLGLLGKMGKTGKDLIDVFRGFESGPQEMFARFGTIQRELFGVEGAKEKFKNAQIGFIKQFDTYRNLTDADALQSFGAAVDRIVSSGARIEDGRLAWDSSPTANARYADAINRDIDQRLLSDPEARKVVDTMKRYFDEIGEQQIESLRVQIDRELLKIGNANVSDTLRDFVDSKLSYKQYKKGFANDKDKISQLKSIEEGKWGDPSNRDRHKNMVDTIIGMHDDKVRFESLKGKYIPQKFSKVKEANEKKKWMQERRSKLEDYDQREIDRRWEREKAKRIVALNNEKFRKMEISDNGMDVEVDYFSSYPSAEARLNTLIDEITDDAKRSVARSVLASQPDQFIRQEMVGGKPMYYLDTPQTLRREGMFPEGIFAEANVDRVMKTESSFVMMNTYKEADFFDRPRNVNLPHEFKELDLEELTRFYSEDMGIRTRAIRNGMYNNYQVDDNWIRPIRDEVKGQFSNTDTLNKRLDEVKSWFSTMQNERKMSAVAIRKGDVERIKREAFEKAKNDNFFNTVAKLATFPFNYATTLYAPFTPMVLGPFLTSWKSIGGVYKDAIFAPKQFAKELKAWTDEVQHMNILQKKFESFAPEYKRLYKDDVLGDPSNFRRKMADFADNATEFSANLSIARAFGVDPENLGILRLAVGNMLDVSGAEAGMVLMATFRHLDDLTKAYQQLKTADSVMLNGKRYTRQTLNRQFNDLGVTEVDSFVSKNDQFNQFTKFMKGEGSPQNIDPEYYSQLVRIMNNTVDQYHGRTKLSRPLSWIDNNWGRALSRYSVYAQNFGVQTTAKRIYQPLRDWSDQYKMTDESVPLFKLAYWAGTGNEVKFKEMFGEQWEGAYNDFPVDAVNNFFKVFGAISVAKAMMITRGGVMDLTGIATNEALGNQDYEVWRNINKQTAIGRYADTDEPFYISDIFSGDAQGMDLFTMFTSALELGVRSGFGGRFAQIPVEDLKFTGGGIMEMTPVTSLPNDIFQRAGKIRQSNYADLPETAAKEVLDFALLRGTVGGTFYDMRQAILNATFKKPKNKGISFVDSETGIPMDVSYYEP